MLSIEAWTDDGQRGNELALRSGESTLHVRVAFAIDPALPAPSLAFGVGHLSGLTVSSGMCFGTDGVVACAPDGSGAVVLTLPQVPLLQGDYLVTLVLACERGLHVYEMAERVITLRVVQSGLEQGLVQLPHRWVSEVVHG